jgi:DNA-binding beta-propeller fold protein YncE
MEGQAAPRELKVGSGGLRWRFSEKNLLTGVDLMALRHDGRVLYLGSTRSNEVSAFDTETLRRVAHVRAGNGLYALARSPNDRHLYALAVSQITVIDTSTHTPLHEHEVGSAKEGFLFPKYLAKRPVFSAERGLAFLADGLAVHVFDLRSGGLLRSIGGLPSPQAVLIPATPRARGEGGESPLPRPPEPGW